MKAIILAAGKGTRLKINKPKALITVLGKPIIEYVIDSVISCNIKDIVVVVGYRKDDVKEHLGDKFAYAVQDKLDGTGGAVKVCIDRLKKDDLVLIVNSDCPLVSSSTLERLISYAKQLKLDACCLSGVVDKPYGYGRILRDKTQKFLGIIEQSEIKDSQCFNEINAGAYVFKTETLKTYLKKLNQHTNGEYYLTDIFHFISADSGKIEAVKLKDINEAFGINTHEDLLNISVYLKNKNIEKFLLQGVNIVDPSSVYIESDVEIGHDTVILPFSVIRRYSKIGSGCEIGPFAHIRGRSVIGNNSVVGNFVEINRSAVGKHTKIKHLSYIGDALLGNNVNIGAGTITANYDGKNKNKTIMKDSASTGSNTVLVAPLVMEENSKTGAGSVVVKNTRIAKNKIYVGVPAKPLNKRSK